MWPSLGLACSVHAEENNSTLVLDRSSTFVLEWIVPDLELENIDTVKAFFTIVLGAAIGAFLFYLYATILRPRLVSFTPAQVTQSTSTGA